MDYLNSVLNSILGEPHWATHLKSGNLPPAPRALEWYEDTEKRNMVSEIFFGLGALSGGVAVFTAVTLTVTVASVILTTSLAVTATALIIAAIYLYTMDPSHLDPTYRMDKRQELLVQDKTPPFYALNSAINGDILSRNEVQTILFEEINRMDYSAFIQKHGIESLAFLDDQNKDLLRPKYVAYLLQRNLGEEEMGNVFVSQEANIFDLNAIELTHPQTQPSLLQNVGSYATSAMDYAAKNGTKIVRKGAEALIPTQIKNATHCASASITYAMQGEYQKSAHAAIGAATFATVYATDTMMKAEHPGAYAFADEVDDYEKMKNKSLLGHD